jgi:hypothetical protein
MEKAFIATIEFLEYVFSLDLYQMENDQNAFRLGKSRDHGASQESTVKAKVCKTKGHYQCHQRPLSMPSRASQKTPHVSSMESKRPTSLLLRFVTINISHNYTP